MKYLLLLGVLSMNAVLEGAQKKNIKIILGSTREGRTSDKIGAEIKRVADNMHTSVEILDLRDFDLPFLYEATSPAQRTSITDPVIKKWSDAVKSADAFIIVVPEYNRSFPAVLKNALDVLYKEWNGKRVALVGYSGGPKGGYYATTHLKDVLDELKMTLIKTELLIPTAWKAFDARGHMTNTHNEEVLKKMIAELSV